MGGGSGIKIVGVFIFWATLGLSWALLNENIVDKFPTMFPGAYSGDRNTYDILNWAWRISLIGLCIGSAVSILGQKGFKATIINSFVLFSGVFIGFLFWVTFWAPVNITIPNAFAAGWGTVSNTMQYQGVYNSIFLIFVLGLTLFCFFVGGTAIIGRRRYRAQRIYPSGSLLPSGKEASKLAKKYRRYNERQIKLSKQANKNTIPISTTLNENL